MKKIFVILFVGLLFLAGCTKNENTQQVTNHTKVSVEKTNQNLNKEEVKNTLSTENTNLSVNNEKTEGKENLENSILNNKNTESKRIEEKKNYTLSKKTNAIQEPVTNEKFEENDKHVLSKKELGLIKQQKLVEELKKKIEKSEEQAEQAREKLDLTYCDKKYSITKLRDDCKLKMAFAKNNKQGCKLLIKDKRLYNKCLEIEKGIKKYRQIMRWKSDYLKYVE